MNVNFKLEALMFIKHDQVLFANLEYIYTFSHFLSDIT